MTWQRSASQWFRLPAQQLWDVISRLELWPQWNPAVAHAELDGPLREGTSGRYSPSHRLIGPLHRRTAPAVSRTAVQDEIDLAAESLADVLGSGG